MTARYLIGDVRERLDELPAHSVDLVLTSPPFLGLRSYLPEDHPDKAKEIGREQDPAAFIDALLSLTEQLDRVLAPHGSLCVELGDTYSGRGGVDVREPTDGRRRAPRPARARQTEAAAYGGGDARVGKERDPDGFTGRRGHGTGGGNGWPLDKSICGIPHLYALSLAYGRNLLTGEPSPAGMWRVRNEVAWCRPNPPVGALGDKYRPATSYMTVACRSRTRWFDLEAVRRPPDERYAQRRFSDAWGARPDGNQWSSGEYLSDEPKTFGNPGGVPPYDWWSVPATDDIAAEVERRGDPEAAIAYLLDVIAELTDGGDERDSDAWIMATEPYRGAHFATWPRSFAARVIQSMCPEQVCTLCGEPRRRIVEPSERYASRANAGADAFGSDRATGLSNREKRKTVPADDPARNGADMVTIGWTDCGHDSWRRGVVLDPFAGSGTTLLAAEGHGRDSIGVDLDGRNAELAVERVGMFLSIEPYSEPTVASMTEP